MIVGVLLAVGCSCVCVLVLIVDRGDGSVVVCLYCLGY